MKTTELLVSAIRYAPAWNGFLQGRVWQRSKLTAPVAPSSTANYGELYKRYDAKKGKKPPTGAIPCCDPDPITGHWPHWVKVDESNPADKWFIAAVNNSSIDEDGTFEAVGPHFQGNPHKLEKDILYRHGIFTDEVKDAPRTFCGLREFLRTHEFEGIVFWRDGEPRCKIKRSDFGFEWPVRGEVTFGG